MGKICTFIGHGKYHYNLEDIDNIKRLAIMLIVNHDVDTFYNGGYGEFDNICAVVINDLKSSYQINNIKILSYYDYKINTSPTFERFSFDSTLYPNLSDKPKKLAIPLRNKWIMQTVDVVISGVRHDWGGAYKSLLLARKYNKPILDILYD